MGKVIQFPFGQGKSDDLSVTDVNQAAEADADTLGEQIMHEEVEWILSHITEANEAVRRVQAFRAFRQSMQGRCWLSGETLRTNETGLIHSRYQELCEIMLASGERDWNRRPAYYLAVEAQMVERTQMLTPYLEASGG